MWYIKGEHVLDFRSSLQGYKNLQAAQQAIDYIKKNFPSPYHVMVSGGIDSQAMLYAWKLFAPKNFIATSVIYDKHYFFNQHDLEMLQTVSNLWNVEIFYENFDILNFYRHQYFEVAEEFQCSSPHICTYIEMTKNLPGTVIFSGNWLGHLIYNKVQHALTLYSNKRPCIPFFFISQPDISYTGINLNLTHTEAKTPEESYKRKIQEYNLAGYPVIRQSSKLSGFEKIKDYYDAHLFHLISAQERIKFQQNPKCISKRTYDLLLRYPLEEKYGEINFQFLNN